jgi:hypothetical protein
VSKLLPLVVAALVAVSCAKPDALTESTAEQVIRARVFNSEPVYAEVPQRVAWSERSPRDAFDDLSIATLENLEREGLVTLERIDKGGVSSVESKVTQKGFPLLGTVPSARGPAWRGRICEKRFAGVRNFARHPHDETIGRAEVVWEYVTPTPLYPLFATKIDKALGEPFISVVTVRWENGAWRVRTLVAKAGRAGGAEQPAPTVAAEEDQAR